MLFDFAYGICKLSVALDAHNGICACFRLFGFISRSQDSRQRFRVGAGDAFSPDQQGSQTVVTSWQGVNAQARALRKRGEHASGQQA